MGSLESNLLTAEIWDFSENNLKNNSGFDSDPCNGGGNAEMSTAYFARWSGPITEADDPYNTSSDVSPPGLTVRKHLQDVLFLPGRASFSDNDNLKQALMTYGAVDISMYYDDPYYDSTNKAYYYNGSRCSANHDVTLVGWDDNYPGTNFSPPATHNGAFIIKNSWGTGWGASGYFYISYDDAVTGYDGSYVFNGAQPTTNYTRVYQYDPLGMTTSAWWGSGPTTTDWFANIFTATATEQLVAVSFYTNDVNVSYAVYIYTNSTSGPTSGTLGGTTTGSITAPGYHTITLSSPVSITTGQKFSVVVRVTNSSYAYPIPLEYPIGGYSSAATASAGQSYWSSNGTNWYDVTSYYPNTNVCVKAFTGNVDTTPPGVPTGLSANPVTWTNANSFSMDWTGPSDPSGIAGAYYKVGALPTFNTDGTYTTSKPFTAAATAQGGQGIYVWLKDGAGNTSYLNNASTTLHYDGTAPSDGILTASQVGAQASLSWTASSDGGGSGLKGTNTYKVVRNTGSNPPVQCTGGTQVYLGAGTSTTDATVTNGLTYYYRACAYDNAGNVSGGALANFILRYQLTTSVNPPGTGSVTPDCTSGCIYNSGTMAGLLAEPANGYIFSSWGGDCSGTNPSTAVLINAATSCTATFTTCEDNPAKNVSSGIPYASIGGPAGAYINAANPDTINLLATTLPETLDLNRAISVTLSGGWNCGFVTQTSYSIIHGLTIGNNSLAVTAEKLIIY